MSNPIEIRYNKDQKRLSFFVDALPNTSCLGTPWTQNGPKTVWEVEHTLRIVELVKRALGARRNHVQINVRDTEAVHYIYIFVATGDVFYDVSFLYAHRAGLDIEEGRWMVTQNTSSASSDQNIYLKCMEDGLLFGENGWIRCPDFIK